MVNTTDFAMGGWGLIPGQGMAYVQPALAKALIVTHQPQA